MHYVQKYIVKTLEYRVSRSTLNNTKSFDYEKCNYRQPVLDEIVEHSRGWNTQKGKIQ